MQSRLDEALADAEEAVRLDPQDARAHRQYATTLEYARRPAEALASIDLALQLERHERGFAPLLWSRARVLRALGRKDEAVEAARTSLLTAQAYDPSYLMRRIRRLEQLGYWSPPKSRIRRRRMRSMLRLPPAWKTKLAGSCRRCGSKRRLVASMIATCQPGAKRELFMRTGCLGLPILALLLLASAAQSADGTLQTVGRAGFLVLRPLPACLEVDLNTARQRCLPPRQATDAPASAQREALETRALMFSYLRGWEEARQELESVIALQPESAEAHHLAARVAITAYDDQRDPSLLAVASAHLKRRGGACTERHRCSRDRRVSCLSARPARGRNSSL